MSNKTLLIEFTVPPDTEEGEEYAVGVDSGSDPTGTDHGEGEKVDEPIALEFDSDRHIERYGTARTSFDITETAYLRFLYQGSGSYEFFGTVGIANTISFRTASTNHPFRKVESLSYVNSWVESLQYRPFQQSPNIAGGDYYNVYTEWLLPVPNLSYPTVTVVGKRCYVYTTTGYAPLPFKIYRDENNTPYYLVTGMLQASYYTKGDRIEVTSNIAGNVIVGILFRGEHYTITVPFTDATVDEDGDPIDDSPTLNTYVINVTSLCAEGVIGGVAVSKNGTPLGNTDGYGQLTFQSYPGTYTFEAVRTGYTTVSKSVTLT